MTYTVFASKINELQTVFNRYAKKAANVGLTATMNIGNVYPKKVDVYENDYANHVTVKTGTTVIDVVDVEINFPEYKLGNYTVVAYIEHGENNKNLVYPCGDVEVPVKYFNAKGICEHCNTNHKRVKTIVLKDTEGNYKQVGKACVKEYTGINEADLVNAYRAINSFFIDNNADAGYFGKVTDSKYTTTIDYLAKCIHYIIKHGYNQDVKYDCAKIKVENLTTEDYNNAEKVIDYFKNIETTDTFINNVKVAVTNEYTKKVNGFVAYAYVAYTKELERIAKEKANTAVEYFGNVGDKFTAKVTGRVIAGYDTQFGYTNIIEFKDNANHIFIWKTTNDIETDNNGIFKGTIKGTIKAHNEYKGVKQTVITRVKAILEAETPEITVTFDDNALRKALELLN